MAWKNLNSGNKKLIAIAILAYLAYDIFHFFKYRIGNDFDIYEATYESFSFSLVKIIACVLLAVGLFSGIRKKIGGYLVLVGSVVLILLILIDGPLHHIYYMYHDVSLWLLFVLSIYLVFSTSKHLRQK